MDEVSKKNKKETRAGTIAGIAAGGVTIAALCFFIGTQVAGNNSARNGMGGPGGMSGQMGNPPNPQDRLNKQGGNQQNRPSQSIG